MRIKQIEKQPPILHTHNPDHFLPSINLDGGFGKLKQSSGTDFLNLISPEEKKISLCVIVKNEMKNIEEFIKNFRDVAHEFVFVDTGSTDGTLGYLQGFAESVNFPVGVYQFEWNFF
jgi:hypothetical protein